MNKRVCLKFGVQTFEVLLYLGSIIMDYVISKQCYKGTIFKRNNSYGSCIALAFLNTDLLELQRFDISLFMTVSAYRLYTVMPKLVKFVDQLTNWYVRMNRKRLKVCF